MTTHVIPANAGISGTLGTAELRNARDGGTAERPGRRNGGTPGTTELRDARDGGTAERPGRRISGTPGTTTHVIPANAGISGKLG